MITMTSPIVLGNGSIACTLLKHCWVACNVHCLHSCHYVPQEALHLGSTVVGRLQCPVDLVMGTTSGYRPMSIACTLLGRLQCPKYLFKSMFDQLINFYNRF